MMRLGDRIRVLREAKGLTQHTLGRLTGLSQQSIHALESGVTQRPRKLDRIAAVLGTTERELLFGDENLSPAEMKLILRYREASAKEQRRIERIIDATMADDEE